MLKTAVGRFRALSELFTLSCFALVYDAWRLPQEWLRLMPARLSWLMARLKFLAAPPRPANPLSRALGLASAKRRLAAA